MMTSKELAAMFDHTLLKPYATKDQMTALCKEAKEHGFKMVAVNSVQSALCKSLLEGSGVHVGAAISFPLGQTTIETKVFETENAIQNGADEIDYVINITELKEKNYAYIEEEMRRITEICRTHNVISKVIFENCYLNEEEKIVLCEIAKKVKPDFIKTSTGFGTSGATLEDVALMKSIVGDDVLVKAAGGIKDLETCLAMIKAGAQRIGTSSSIDILKNYEKACALGGK